MEDDEEIRSHSTPPVEVDAGNNNNDDDEYDRESSSSSSSLRSHGRITVISSISQPPQPAASISPSRSSIREATTVITPPSHCSVTLALPIQNPQPTHSTGKTSNNASGGSSGGREDCWSEGATAVLIEAWGERFMQLSRGNLKQKHWQEVAEIVSARDGHWRFPKTDVQCKNRIDTVKKKYKSEKSKISSGAAVSSNWRFFDQLDSLIALSASPTLSPLGKQRVPVGIPVGRPIHHHHLTSLPKHKPISLFSSPDDYNQRNIYGVGPCDNKQRSKRPIIVGSTESPDSNDGHPPVAYVASLKKARTELRSHGGGGSAEGGGGEGKVLNGRKTEKGWGSWGRSVRELTRAILRFREVYEQAEEDKLHQMVEMEEQRMKFAKELELQRMKFLMKTQMDLSRLRHGSGVNVEIAASGSGKGRGGGVNVNHHSKIHRNIHDKNRDDDNRNYNNINKNDSSN